MKTYDVPFAYQKYGRISVKANSRKEAINKAYDKIKAMTAQELEENALYLSDSEEIDEEGIFYVDGKIEE